MRQDIGLLCLQTPKDLCNISLVSHSAMENVADQHIPQHLTMCPRGAGDLLW